MSEVILSSEQILDAAGSAFEIAKRAARAESSAIITDTTPVPVHAFGEVATAYDQWHPKLSYFDIPHTHANTLCNYPGLRVIAGLRVSDVSGSLRPIFVPGIVLEGTHDSPSRIGILYGGPDVMTSPDALDYCLARPLSDLQEQLLQQVYGMHKPGVGIDPIDKTTGLRLPNIGDTAEASMVAITDPNNLNGLHGRVHEYANKGLAASIARTGSLDIMVQGRRRPVAECTLPTTQASRIIVSAEHQPIASCVLLDGKVLGAGELAVGMTLAAVRSKGGVAGSTLALRAGNTALLRQ
jgi:hypothetical protein